MMNSRLQCTTKSNKNMCSSVKWAFFEFPLEVFIKYNQRTDAITTSVYDSIH